MSKEKFTRGPWYVHATGPHWNNPEIANYEICYSGAAECVVDHVYELPDAHLIAAAPDMHQEIEREHAALLWDIQNFVAEDEDGVNKLEKLKTVAKRKSKLLAKARGEL